MQCIIHLQYIYNYVIVCFFLPFPAICKLHSVCNIMHVCLQKDCVFFVLLLCVFGWVFFFFKIKQMSNDELKYTNQTYFRSNTFEAIFGESITMFVNDTYTVISTIIDLTHPSKSLKYNHRVHIIINCIYQQ